MSYTLGIWLVPFTIPPGPIPLQAVVTNALYTDMTVLISGNLPVQDLTVFLPSHLPSHSIDFIFQNSRSFIEKLSSEFAEFSYTSSPLTYTASLTVNIQHQSGTVVTTHEPTLTHYNHQKFIVYVKVYPWYVMSYGS